MFSAPRILIRIYRTQFQNNTLQWVSTQPHELHMATGSYDKDARETRRLEGAHVRGLDSVLTLQSTARALEAKLEVKERWTPESDDWKRVDKSWQEREFDKAVDRLEGLVIARIFELEKMNQVGLCEISKFRVLFRTDEMQRLQASYSH